MILYHGSKSGIKGNIRAISREACDFGQGFYTGDRPDQPKGLIAEYPNNMFYELESCLDELSVKEFGNSYEEQIDWALFVAYNRGKLDSKYTKLCERYREYNERYDVIKGVIADDKMTQALMRFFSGDICDKALIEALQKVRLGNQYVFKNDEACSEKYMKIISQKPLTEKEKKMEMAVSKQREGILDGIFEQLKTKYRRVQYVRYFDEIIEEWNR